MIKLTLFLLQIDSTPLFKIDNNNHLYIFIAGLVIAFIIGYRIGYSIKKHAHKSELEKCMLEKTRLSNHLKKEPLSFTEDNTIKAIQTRGRSGMALDTDIKVATVKKQKITKKLDFSKIGVATEANKDDLKRIEGIGPFIEKKLNSIGLFKYDQLSRLTDDDIEVVTELIEFFPGRIKRDDWKGKAQKLKEENTKKV
ncbi:MULTISPECIES: hypothetical protein [Galbibacter]|uniref:Flap endonuclease-1-like 5' DNA nuclease n=1 Tax=Galbibacter pacificus TaxID=2996052 RepID=A0ABT6FQU1_9FLAO|nr:hypothetical protein [Galbibacter pacificus]MDG3581931.1 hypothetical protein [Galbibacter pacificus]MDG3585595.1 hypothetical protein [Galbibacter pacificus]